MLRMKKKMVRKEKKKRVKMMELREAPKRMKVVKERLLLRNRMIAVGMKRRTVLLITIAHAYPMRMTTRRPSWT